MSCPTKKGREDEEEDEALTSDAIGDTVYSKKWLVFCLLKTIEFVQNEPSADEVNCEPIEEELGLLWDMSANKQVQECMLQNKAHEIFMSCALKTNSPRLAEISMGILGNLIHNDEISKLVSADTEFRTAVIELLSSTDIPFLTQLIRFLTTILFKEASAWHMVISHNQSSLFASLQFLLQNCLNVDLLKLVFKLLNQILYGSDLAGLWFDSDTEHELVHILCQACVTILSSLDISDEHENSEEWTGVSPASVDFFYHFWFIIQSIYEEKLYSDKFKAHLHQLDDLFGRYGSFLSEKPNSLLSYAAACSFYMALFDSAQKDPANNSDWKPVLQLKAKMRQDTVLMATHRRAIELNASSAEQMSEQLKETLVQFDRDVLDSH